MTEPLIVAVPSKGRLQENTAAFFARAGLKLSQGRGIRDYRGSLGGLPGIEVLFLSAGDIPGQLAAGGAHLGITGEDLIREEIPDADRAVELLTPLGFGQANVVVAVPQAWIDVRTMADLDEVAADLRARHGRKLRVATKYVNLTRRTFAAHGVADYRIVESLGATEGAPASGAAEIIVDITSTGATLAANGLKVLDDGTILRSEANLVASLNASWDAAARDAARTMLGRIAAAEQARTTREVRALGLDVGLDLTALAAAAGLAPLASSYRSGEAVMRCQTSEVFTLVEALIAAGATEVSVRQPEYVFRPSNPLIERLLKRLGA